jgi:hypothetical protein
VKRILIFLLILVICTNNGVVQAEENRGIAGVPTLKSPLNTILSKTPTYSWSKVNSATHYQYQVYRGTNKLSDITILSSACGSSTCSHKPSLKLGYNLYKWRARAKVAGVWQAWAAFKTFAVSPPGFYSGFNGSMSGWAKMGSYSWHVNATELYTDGVNTKYSNVYRINGKYSDFDFSVKIKRSDLSNGLAMVNVRMGDNVSEYNHWYTGYEFGYAENAYIIVAYAGETGGSETLFTRYDTSILNDYDWNILRVIAYGDLMFFFINNELITTITDDRQSRGYVGISAYATANVAHVVEVDWAKLTVLLKAADYEKAIMTRTE